MIRPDLICVWPDTVDFPLFSKFLNEERDRFEKVIIVFSETNWGKLTVSKVMGDINDALFLPPLPTPPGEDWRNFAVNRALKHSFAQWIWFTEQDFTPKDGFFESVQKLEAERKPDAMGILEETRLHPCSLFIKRSVLEKTTKDFSANPEKGYDHFGKLWIDLEALPSKVRVGLLDPSLYTHMAGLTHNLHLLMQEKVPNYKPDEFYEYLQKVVAYEQSKIST